MPDDEALRDRAEELEARLKALGTPHTDEQEHYWSVAQKAIQSLRKSRREALEDAAEVVENTDTRGSNGHLEPVESYRKRVADAIRDLKEADEDA